MFHASALDLKLSDEVRPFNLQGRIPNALAVFSEALALGPDAAFRMLRAFNEGQSGQGSTLLIEARSEQIRAAEFGNRPPRSACSFAFGTLAEALTFCAPPYNRQHVFKVEPVGQPEIWAADFATFTVGPTVNAPAGAEIGALDSRLRTYWQTMTQELAATRPGWELLVVGRLRVVSACLAPAR